MWITLVLNDKCVVLPIKLDFKRFVFVYLVQIFTCPEYRKHLILELQSMPK